MANTNQDPANTTCLLSLPPEILAQEIFSHLPLISLIRCLSTCKQINELISSSIELTYQIELEVAGMKDNPRCSYTRYPVIKRLKMLRERERRWSGFDWKWRREVEFPPMSSNHDLAPGLYLRTKYSDEGQGMTGIYCGILPSDKDSAVTWIEANLGKEVVDFTESVENDLLACVSLSETSYSSAYRSIQVDFLALSTGLPHPQAASPTLDVCFHYDPDDDPELCVETCGENFALTYESNDRGPGFRATLYVWDWRTGKRKCQIPIGSQTGLAGLVFLREDFFVHMNSQGNCLDIFHINPSDHPDIAGNDVRFILSLAMPGLTPGYLVKLQSINHPSPSCSANITPLINTSSRPFLNDTQTEVIFITSDITHPIRHENWRFALLTHRNFLLELALGAWASPTSGAGVSEPEDICLSLSWEEWGSLSTRIFPLSPYIQNASHATAGQRWAWISPQAEGTGDMLELVDLNQLRLRRTCQSWSDPTKATNIHMSKWTNTRVVADLDLVPAMVFPAKGGVFVEDIYSYLPCIRIRYSRDEAPGTPPETIPRRKVPGSDNGQAPSETPATKYVAITGVRMEEERIIGHYSGFDGEKPMMDVIYFG